MPNLERSQKSDYETERESAEEGWTGVIVSVSCKKKKKRKESKTLFIIKKID